MKKKVTKDKKWDNLRQLIRDYANAAISESWKGGGDPEDMPLFEAELELARLKLDRYLDKLEQEFNER